MSVSVTYNIQGGASTPGLPLVNSTTPPSAGQAAQTQEIIAQVTMATTDVQALITHNWGFTTSQVANLFRPQVIGPLFITAPVGASFGVPVYTFAWLSNVLQVNKTSGAGTDGTFILILRLPWSGSL